MGTPCSKILSVPCGLNILYQTTEDYMVEYLIIQVGEIKRNDCRKFVIVNEYKYHYRVRFKDLFRTDKCNWILINTLRD